MKLHGRNLAEISIFYALAIGLAFFILLFAMSATSAINTPAGPFIGIGVFVSWVVALIYFTFRLARSQAVQNARLTLAPIHLLQFTLLLFTLPHYIFAREYEINTLNAILLTWEVFAVLFTFSFLFLAALGRRRIAIKTWAYSLVSSFSVLWTLYIRIQKS
jgi:hypothetical protein